MGIIEEFFLKNTYTKRETIITYMCKCKCLETQPEIDLDRTIGLTNRHEQKIFLFCT